MLREESQTEIERYGVAQFHLNMES
jgi:hypothetical protein